MKSRFFVGRLGSPTRKAAGSNPVGRTIVDIAEIEHSYRVQFEWSSDLANPHLSGYAVLVTCPENDEMIYSGFECTDMLTEQEQVITDLNEAYPIMKDLPIYIDYFIGG